MSKTRAVKEQVKEIIEYLKKYEDDVIKATYQPLFTLTNPPMGAIITINFDHGKRLFPKRRKK